MKSSNDFQAAAFKDMTKNGTRTLRAFSAYTTVPAFYPNREVRRKLRQRKPHLLPAEARAFFNMQAQLAAMTGAVRVS